MLAAYIIYTSQLVLHIRGQPRNTAILFIYIFPEQVLSNFLFKKISIASLSFAALILNIFIDYFSNDDSIKVKFKDSLFSFARSKHYSSEHVNSSSHVVSVALN